MNRALVPSCFRGWRRPALALLALGFAFSPSSRGQGALDGDTGYSDYLPSPFPSGYSELSNSSFGSMSRRIPVFFPPIPPQLGLALETLDPSPGRLAAPVELGAYVNEPFYAPLSTRLAEKNLQSKLRTELEAYRTAKTALQSELRARLDSLANADAFTRQRELAAFARVQTPRIAALEITAEELRPDLIAGGLFRDSADWNDSRRWQLTSSGFRTPLEAIRAQSQVMRGAAFYQKGLSPAQRRLLREVAMELADVSAKLATTGDANPDLNVSADANPLFYFSPETARFRLPIELPAEIGRKISNYESGKSALKAELRQLVAAQDRAALGFLRTRAFEDLAKKQEPRILALELLAEEIRRDLALLPNVAPPPAPPAVPAAIAAHMANLIQERKAAQKSILHLVQEIKKIISVSRIDGTQTPEGRIKLSIVVNPRDRTEEKIKPVQEMVAKYNAENEARLRAIELERAVVHDEVVRFVGPGTEDVEKTVQDLLAESYATLERQEEWALYKDYRTAMLEPGLSPEQRRLLYDGALEMLELPLPTSERMILGLQ